MKRDRLSTLDDNLLSCYILSRLPLRDAVVCSLLSKRWRYLWRLIPHLKIFNVFCEDETEQGSVIESIMFFHSVEVQSFELVLNHFIPPWEVNQSYRKWVGFASLKKVKQISLFNFGLCVRVPTTLFLCNHLTFLKLVHFKFKRIPNSFGGFRHLKSCYLTHVKIKDDKLKLLVADCPLLEDLTVDSCERLSNVEILSGSLNYLKFIENSHPSSMTVNCPLLVNMIVHGCPDLCRLKLNSCGDLHLSTTEPKVLKGLSTRSSLKKMTLHELIADVSSLTVLRGFSCLEELSIESKSFKAASPELGSLTLALENLKKVHVKVFRFSEEEICLLGCLFRIAPSLQTMTLNLPVCPQYVHERIFMQQLSGLKRPSGEATVLIITEKHGEHCQRCPPS